MKHCKEIGIHDKCFMSKRDSISKYTRNYHPKMVPSRNYYLIKTQYCSSKRDNWWRRRVCGKTLVQLNLSNSLCQPSKQTIQKPPWFPCRWLTSMSTCIWNFPSPKNPKKCKYRFLFELHTCCLSKHICIVTKNLNYSHKFTMAGDEFFMW